MLGRLAAAGEGVTGPCSERSSVARSRSVRTVSKHFVDRVSELSGLMAHCLSGDVGHMRNF